MKPDSDTGAPRIFRVLHVITRLDSGGSAENTLLTSLGHDTALFHAEILCGFSDIPPSVNEKKALDAGIRIVRLRRLVRHISPLDDLIAFCQVYRHIRNGRFDLVHTHTSKAGIIGRFAAKAAGVRRIVHTPHGHIFYGYFPAALTRAFVLLEWAAMNVTDIQITLTAMEKNDYVKRGIAPAAKMVPIHSGIEPGPLQAPRAGRDEVRRSLGLESSDFVAGTVARLDPVKNHRLIIDAAPQVVRRIPRIRFVFVGDGELLEGHRERVRGLGLERHFVFTGWRTDVSELLYAFDIFIMCSKNEGQGRAFIEAQAAGVPVIGSRVGGIPEAIDEGRTGFLVGPDDPGGLAEKITALYEMRDRHEETARACRQWVFPRFSAKTMTEKIDSLYLDLLRRKRKPAS
jgi:glycosyltransferase involved in cell wall biosynthesis